MCRMLTSGGQVLPSVIISFVLSRHLNGRINQILSVGIPLHICLHNPEVMTELLKQQKQKEQKDIVGKLTERQKEVIQLRVNGYSEKETAEKLCISHKTVKSHCQEIRSLLNVHNLLQLIRLAVTCGLN
jgi:DNA-binding NarL/FixJ family response regulator